MNRPVSSADAEQFFVFYVLSFLFIRDLDYPLLDFACATFGDGIVVKELIHATVTDTQQGIQLTDCDAELHFFGHLLSVRKKVKGHLSLLFFFIAHAIAVHKANVMPYMPTELSMLISRKKQRADRSGDFFGVQGFPFKQSGTGFSENRIDGKKTGQ